MLQAANLCWVSSCVMSWRSEEEMSIAAGLEKGLTIEECF